MVLYIIETFESFLWKFIGLNLNDKTRYWQPLSIFKLANCPATARNLRSSVNRGLRWPLLEFVAHEYKLHGVVNEGIIKIYID